MSGPLLYDFGGLVTAPGLLARNPASCVDVSNFRFPQPGVMRKRTGYVRQTGAPVAAEVFTALYSSAQLKEKLLAFGNTSSNPIYYGSPNAGWSALTDIGTNNNGPRNRGMAAVGNSHFMNGSSIKRLENNFTRYRGAGMPRGQTPYTYSMDAAVYSVLGGAGGIVPDGSNVAYRVTYCRKDDAGGIIEGPPTGRLVVRNIAGTSGYAAATARNITLRIPLPIEVGATTATPVGTDTFWRLYRSRIAAVDTADDEMYLVAEAFFTATDIANGYAATTDQTPDAFLYGAPTLHTNALNFPEAGPNGPNGSINGQILANESPWYAKDICEFAGCLFAACPTSRPSQLITLLSSAFVAGNTVTIDGVVLTAVAGAPAAVTQFTIVAGLGSLSLNIEATARNIVDAFNRSSVFFSKKTEAFYISQGASLPGQILIESRIDQAFNVQSATAGNLFRPSIISAQSSVRTTGTNVVNFSKPQRGDAFAPANSLTVGPGSGTVLRMVAFRERLLCWTTEGLYQVDGTYESGFTVSLVDSSLHLFQREAVVVAEDRCLAWCFEGIAEVADGGTQVISKPIEPTLQAIVLTTSFLGTAQVYSDAFAVVDQRNHLVKFCYTINSSDGVTPYSQNWLEWDSRERKWSTGNCAVALFSSGAVQRASGLVVLAGGDTNYDVPTSPGAASVFVQRATGTSTDYQDANSSAVSSAISSSATFQFQLPDSDARQHWQQLLMHFENGDFTLFSKPSSLFVRWETDVATSAELTLAPTAAIAKLETPRVTRRATRQRVRLRHTLAENLGLVLLNQSVNGSGARFPK